MDKPMSFLQALMHAFKRANQTTADFAAEVRALTDADKVWFRSALIDAGYQLV